MVYVIIILLITKPSRLYNSAERKNSMDYNYIRMRNAEKDGNTELAAHYRQLYEAGTDLNAASYVFDYILILLTVIAIVLGIYTIHYSKSVPDTVPEKSVTEVTPTAVREHSEV